MMSKIAHVVSIVLHPLFMPLLCFFIAYHFDWYLNGIVSTDQMNIIYLIVGFSTIVFPGINILLLKWYGVVTSLSMENRSERNAPYISTVFFFALGYYMLRKGALPQSFFSILIGCITILVLVTLINFKWKISAHSSAIFGIVGAVIALFQLHSFSNITLLCSLLMLGGLVMSSRLALRAHTAAESYSGAVIGFITLYSFVYFEVFI